MTEKNKKKINKIEFFSKTEKQKKLKLKLEIDLIKTPLQL